MSVLQIALLIEATVVLIGFGGACFIRHRSNYAPADMGDLPANLLGLAGTVAFALTLIGDVVYKAVF